MPVQIAALEQAIRDVFPVSHLQVEDQSDGCGESYSVLLVSEAFEGKTTLARHRLINEVLKVQIAQMHAFSQVRHTRNQLSSLIDALAENVYPETIRDVFGKGSMSGGVEKTEAVRKEHKLSCLGKAIRVLDQSRQDTLVLSKLSFCFRLDHAHRFVYLSAEAWPCQRALPRPAIVHNDDPPKKEKYKGRIFCSRGLPTSTSPLIQSINNMSDAAFPQQHPDLDEWDHILAQLEQQWPVRDKVSTALNEANAAFAAQFMQPDAYKYAGACDRLTSFLDQNVRLEDSEQKLLVQILQVACAMHQNAVNNPALSKAERSAHYLATTSLVPLCKRALESGVTDTELWCEVFSLNCRAEQALSNAAEALDLSKYLDFGNIKDDNFCETGNDAGETSATLSHVPTTSKLATPRLSVHDIRDVRQTPGSAKLKEKALVALNVNDRSPKAPPLGRPNTMPSASETTSSSRTARAPSKASRGHGLRALQEIGE
ncbi:hypothetical protein J3R82DRAFT_8803 [Butyriboletus roseoflavus]|nr:hypothetical protein J3R82DRAFT_8803 [Butyriboletus roseoflavus]